MTNKYLVKLTPLGNFFFGSERTFNAENKVNYLAYSNQFPQQTSLLGMLRYWLLQQNKPFGEHGFKLNFNNSYGIIERLSPVFLIKNDEILIEAGHNFHGNEEIEITVKGKNKVQSPNFDVKKDKTRRFFNIAQNDFGEVELNDVFIPTSQIGIKKNYSGSADDDAFFKQTFYRMKKGFAFGFYVETNEALPNIEKNHKATLGADQSLFKMEFSEIKNDTFLDTMETDVENAKFVLLSDAYVRDDVRQYCDFSFIETTDFRYISTNIKTTKRFYNVSKNEDDATKSKRLTVIKRGSVLFAHDVAGLQKALDIIPFQRIGYNHYQIQKTK